MVTSANRWLPWMIRAVRLRASNHSAIDSDHAPGHIGGAGTGQKGGDGCEFIRIAIASRGNGPVGLAFYFVDRNPLALRTALVKLSESIGCDAPGGEAVHPDP